MGNEFRCIGRIRLYIIEAFIFVLACLALILEG